MVSADTRIALSSQVRPHKPAEIRSGDHSSASFRATTCRRRALRASRHGCGRRVRAQARSSAAAARYAVRPPAAATSRLIVEGARPSEVAIARSASPLARAREISSRSKSVSALARRLRVRGRNPPVARTTKRIELWCFASARPISSNDWPAVQRCQSSRFCAGDKPHPRCAIRTPPAQRPHH